MARVLFIEDNSLWQTRRHLLNCSYLNCSGSVDMNDAESMIELIPNKLHLHRVERKIGLKLPD